jgi:hypothetical protein
VEYVRRDCERFVSRGSRDAEDSTGDFTEEYYKGFYIDSFGKKNIYRICCRSTCRGGLYAFLLGCVADVFGLRSRLCLSFGRFI